MAGDLDIVIAEQRRLLREVKELRARVAAFESSRWWRLHPRFALRRLRPQPADSPRPENGGVASRASESTGDATNPLAMRFREEIVARGTFSSDLVSRYIPTWEPFLRELEDRVARILEIGSFEGMSACYFLWRLPDARITCVDSFAGSSGIGSVGAHLSALEQTFDRNVSLVGSNRVRKLVGDSGRVLF